MQCIWNVFIDLRKEPLRQSFFRPVLFAPLVIERPHQLVPSLIGYPARRLSIGYNACHASSRQTQPCADHLGVRAALSAKSMHAREPAFQCPVLWLVALQGLPDARPAQRPAR